MTRPPTIKAKRQGICHSCRGGWRIGTWITLLDEKWVHRKSAAGDRPPPTWSRGNTPEARAYRQAAAAGEGFLPRRRRAWREQLG